MFFFHVGGLDRGIDLEGQAGLEGGEKCEEGSRKIMDLTL